MLGLVVAAALVIPTFGTLASGQPPAAPKLGTINFPTSANAAAQALFLTGTMGLYNFEFDLAAEAFQAAQKADPDFALASWAEAMRFNHPLWAEQEQTSALKVLDRLAPIPAARAAKAPAGKERGLIEAVDVLFGAGDKLSRDIAYAAAMDRLHAEYPKDDELATFY